MQLDLNQLCELLKVLDSTGISELSLKSGDFELTVSKGARPIPVAVTPGNDALGNAIASSNLTNPGAVDLVSSSGLALANVPLTSSDAIARNATQTTVTGGRSMVVPPPAEPKWVEVISPMVGTFYRAPGPDEPPFVQVGDRVKIGQTVCIIEAMKLMNEIEAEVAGTVVEILRQNAEPLEYGQPLMRINPD
ncbi:acetyl-CoA carboxylase, biotin carboxyl carrier protein [Oscillatoriales cyanobacterium USR001]|nr:acetyl-CoA carboxylase, biotin carboxyl carrier protein [Oscillatoriales cyanobacterium USR001]